MTTISSSAIQSPGYYNLRSLVIQNAVGVRSDHFSGVALDISNLVPTLSISTSIDRTSLAGHFRVYDGVGVLEKFPLRGEERASIVINDSLGNEMTYDVFCYKIDGVTISNENGIVSYTVHFVSYQSFVAGKSTIIKAIREKTISQVVNELFAEHYNPSRSSRPSDRSTRPTDRVAESSNKGIIVYPETDGIVRYTIPKLRPDEALQFLARRAFSQRSLSSTYRFFESARSYHFTTDEALFDVANQRSKSFEMTFSDAIPKDPAHFAEAMNNLDAVINSARVNTIDDMYGGAYRNKIHVLDILSGSVNLNDPGYSYLENRGQYFSAENSQVEDRHTEQFAEMFFNENVQKTFLMVKDYMDGDGNDDAALAGNRSLDVIGSHRVAYKKHISSITVEATGPGRLDITCGDVIDLNATEFNTDTSAPQLNRQLSGKYIVRSVVHSMNGEMMTNNYVLIKREWSTVSGQQRGSFGLPSLPSVSGLIRGALT
jgi:hypothetical protein